MPGRRASVGQAGSQVVVVGVLDQHVDQAPRYEFLSIADGDDPIDLRGVGPAARHCARFTDFVHHLEKSDPADMNPHWAPQSLLLMRDRLDYDFIGKFEDMAEDGAKVLERLGIDESLEALSEVPHQTGADRRIAEYYTPELIERIGRLYAEDVELGGYEPPAL